MDAINNEPTEPKDFNKNCKEIAALIINIVKEVKPKPGSSSAKHTIISTIIDALRSATLMNSIKMLCKTMLTLKQNAKLMEFYRGHIVTQFIVNEINKYIPDFNMFDINFTVLTCVSTTVDSAFAELKAEAEKRADEAVYNLPLYKLEELRVASAIASEMEKRNISNKNQGVKKRLIQVNEEEARIAAEEEAFEKSKEVLNTIPVANTEVNHPDDGGYELPENWDADIGDEGETVNNVNSVEQPNQEHEPMLSLAVKVASHPQQDSIPIQNEGIG